MLQSIVQAKFKKISCRLSSVIMHFLLQMEEENEIEYMFEINIQKQFLLLLKCFDRKISEATCSPLNFVMDLAISINTGGQAVAATTSKMVSSSDELVTIAYATFYENYFVRKQIKSRVFLDISQRQNMKYFKTFGKFRIHSETFKAYSKKKV